MARGNATSEEEDMAGEELALLKKERISGEECAPAGESVWKVRPCSDGRSSLEAPARTTAAKKTRAKGTAMANEFLEWQWSETKHINIETEKYNAEYGVV